MRLLYSTESLPSGNRFKLWRELLTEQFGAFEQTRLDDRSFAGAVEAMRLGSLPIIRFTQSAAEQKTNKRPGHGSDTVLAIFKLSGTITGTIQDDRAAVQRPGDLVVLNRRPSTLGTPEAGRSLILELPRARLEGMLGPSSLYTSLTIGAELPSTALALTFFRELIQVGGQLERDAAERMASIGIDLLVASIAERMAARCLSRCTAASWSSVPRLTSKPICTTRCSTHPGLRPPWASR